MTGRGTRFRVNPVAAGQRGQCYRSGGGNMEGEAQADAVAYRRRGGRGARGSPEVCWSAAASRRATRDEARWRSRSRGSGGTGTGGKLSRRRAGCRGAARRGFEAAESQGGRQGSECAVLGQTGRSETHAPGPTAVWPWPVSLVVKAADGASFWKRVAPCTPCRLRSLLPPASQSSRRGEWCALCCCVCVVCAASPVDAVTRLLSAQPRAATKSLQ